VVGEHLNERVGIDVLETGCAEALEKIDESLVDWREDCEFRCWVGDGIEQTSFNDGRDKDGEFGLRHCDICNRIIIGVRLGRRRRQEVRWTEGQENSIDDMHEAVASWHIRHENLCSTVRGHDEDLTIDDLHGEWKPREGFEHLAVTEIRCRDGTGHDMIRQYGVAQVLISFIQATQAELCKCSCECIIDWCKHREGILRVGQRRKKVQLVL